MEDLDEDVPVFRMNSVRFRLYSADEIKSLSVKEITNPQTFDQLQHPTTGGLHDAALGPSEHDDVCTTCGQNFVFCPGHMGHIQLPLPVFNPIYFKILYQILRGSCFSCHHLNAKSSACQLLVQQVALLNKGWVSGAWLLADYATHLLTETAGTKRDVDISQQLDSFIHDNFSDEHFGDKLPVKNVEAARKQIVERFIKTQFGVKSKCLHCKCRVRPMKQEYNAKLLLFGSAESAEHICEEAKKKLDATNKSVSLDDENEENEIVEMDEDSQKDKDVKGAISGVEVTVVTPVDAKEHMRKLWRNESMVLKMLFQCLSITENTEHPTDLFFQDVIPVPPPRFRPLSVMGERRYENPQTANLTRVLEDSELIKEILRHINKSNKKENTDIISDSVKAVSGDTLTHKLQTAWSRLQIHANCLIDSSLDRLSTDKQPGIKQLLEKKQGLFRKHMMGKRVNFAARSVISPDPCINTNEIGVPEVFAKKLTYPQPVTPWNVHELKQAVINGPLKHPGATMVINEKGLSTRLLGKDRVQREAIAKTLLTPSVSTSYLLKPKTVLRHLKNGDYLLLNRQPTLHKASMQAHQVRVLKGQKTLRMHYSNCKAYNADFDGDEMNAHFVQSELARAEAAVIASTDNQYLVPKDGTPLAGLIQDHMVSGVWLTVRGTFFNRDDFCQLLYSSLPENHRRVTDIPPAILKPCRLWSGKQIVSSLLLNIIPEGKPLINMEGNSKIPEKSWQKSMKHVCGSFTDSDLMGESVVVVRGGELLQGVLDKGHYGPTPFGLVHCCYEIYGGEIAGKLITSLGRLFRAYLQLRGFTLGVEDILVTKHADKQRKNFIAASPNCAVDAVVKALDVEAGISQADLVRKLREAHLSRDDRQMRELDLAMKSKTDEIQNSIAKACIPHGLHKSFPYNNLQLMAQSGAKGSSVNCMQISCLLGQIELEGRRPPLMMAGRALPSFLPYDPTPRAGGFVTGRFLTGIAPPEYFFHCMAGREGLVDTAVKTSRSGYLQRCLVKHLEGLMVSYDLTVRDSDGSIVQFYYGEDGLDVIKTPFITPKQFSFLVWNRNNLTHNSMHDKPASRKIIKKLNKKIHSWRRKHCDVDGSRQSGYLTFYREHLHSFTADDDRTTTDTQRGRTRAANIIEKAWRSLSAEERLRYGRHSHRCPDPVMSVYRPSEHPSVVSEKIPVLISEFNENQFTQIVKQFPGSGLQDFTIKDFTEMLNTKVLRSMAEPGEAVGLLCAQSIGEPSTQMTLNTFHFAGRGEMNVTLGIPRLREIIMVASAMLKTPSMDITVKNISGALHQAKKLQKKLNRVVLSQVLQDVEVCETLSISGKSKFDRHRKFRVKFVFLPHAVYKESVCLKPRQVIERMESSVIGQLIEHIKIKMKALQQAQHLNTGAVRSNTPAEKQEVGGNDDGETSDVEVEEEGSSLAVRDQKRQQESQEYEGEEQEKELVDSEDDNDLIAGNDASEVVLEEENQNDGQMDEMTKEKQMAVENRILKVKQMSQFICDYKFDVDKSRWCELTLQYGLTNSKIDFSSLIEGFARKAVIHQVAGISRAFLIDEKRNMQSEWHLKTEGVNIQEMYKYADILDVNQLYTNDVHAFAKIYGIEAAAKVLIKEIKNVFGAYGINVDYRHLSLLTDYMTFEGSYKALNRIAMETNASPFQKMTFETTMNFLAKASLHNGVDFLKSPSSRIVTGRVVNCGTGCFEVRQPLM